MLAQVQALEVQLLVAPFLPAERSIWADYSAARALVLEADAAVEPEGLALFDHSPTVDSIQNVPKHTDLDHSKAVASAWVVVYSLFAEHGSGRCSDVAFDSPGG